MTQNCREQITDNRELDLEQNNGELLINEADFRSDKVKREDQIYGGLLEYRPSGKLDRYFISTLYSKFDDHEQRNQYVFDFSGGAQSMGNSVTPRAVGQQDLILVAQLLEDGLYENSTWTNTLGADWGLKNWFIEGRVNFTQTENSMFLPI